MHEHYADGLTGETYAEFACGTCEHHFFDKLPPLEHTLPRCQYCGALVRIVDVLVELIT